MAIDLNLQSVIVGKAGKSAYESWLALGNVGSEADFIASLKGAPGSGSGSGSVDLSAIEAEIALKQDKVAGFGLSSNDYTTAEKSKLGGVSVGATANASDALLRDRSTHTGVQAISTVTGLQAALDVKVATIAGKGLSTNDYTTADQSKLAGIAAGATANSADATLLARANHTGTQAVSTITGLQAALDAGTQANADLATRTNNLSLNYVDQVITPWADSRGAQNWSTSTTPAAPLSRSPLWRMEAKGQMVRVRYDQMQAVSGDSVAQLLSRITTDTAPTGISIKPSQVPPGIAWVQIGTNSVNASVPLGAQGVPGSMMGDIHSILDFLVSKGHRVMLLAEWPRGDTSADSGLLTADNQKLMYALHNALLKVKRKNVFVVDVWPRMADPVRTDAAPLPNFLNNDNLHESIGAAEVTAQEAIRVQRDEMSLPRLKITAASNGDQYDATINLKGCLNTNPMLVQGTGGTVTAGTAYDGSVAASGVAPQGYTLSASGGLKVVGSFGTVTLPNGDIRSAFIMTVSGRATTNNAYVSLRQAGLLTKVAVGDVVEANYECLVTSPNPNFSAPGIMIDTGAAATRAYGGLSITNDKQMPASIIRPADYLVPQSTQLSLATLPASLSFELRPYFVLGGTYSATAGSDLSVDSSVTLAIMSCSIRKV